jgi:mono/diheme cytochrome c family protein
MPERIADAPWLFWLLEAVHRCQVGLLQLWHALGLSGEVDGQPAWPWAAHGGRLLQDLGQARQLVWSLAAVAAVLVLVGVAVLWRRGRPWLLAGALLALVLAPWPERQVVLASAVPTSFHRNPLPFTDAAIVQGAALYQRQCLRCHGEAGNGQGPDAADQPVWPPSFPARCCGAVRKESCCRRCAMACRMRRGARPCLALPRSCRFPRAGRCCIFCVPRRRATAACHGQLGPAHCLARHAVALPPPGQAAGARLAGPAPAGGQQRPRAGCGAGPAHGDAVAAPAGAGCCAPSRPCGLRRYLGATALQALGWINAGESVREVQLLADKAGWLRARNGRGTESWSDDDLLCRTTDAPAAAGGRPKRTA